MMPYAPSEIRQQLCGVRAALTGSAQEDFPAHIQALEAAVADLQALAGQWREAPPEAPEQRARLRKDVQALAAEVRRLERLVQSGEEFWRGWAQLLGLDTGYTPSGLSAPLLGPAETAPRMSVKA